MSSLLYMNREKKKYVEEEGKTVKWVLFLYYQQTCSKLDTWASINFICSP